LPRRMSSSDAIPNQARYDIEELSISERGL
jgi:hypothetical protein